MKNRITMMIAAVAAMFAASSASGADAYWYGEGGTGVGAKGANAWSTAALDTAVEGWADSLTTWSGSGAMYVPLADNTINLADGLTVTTVLNPDTAAKNILFTNGTLTVSQNNGWPGAGQQLDSMTVTFGRRFIVWGSSDPSLNCVLSIWPTTSNASPFATDRYELWNASTLIALIVLMFIGGCSGSTAGGAKVFRVLLAFKVFFQSLAEKFSPNVVRVTRVDGENVDKDTLHSAVTYIFVMAALVFVMTALVAAYEPDLIWLARGESQVEKVADLYVASVSMFANVGPAFGALGSFENYGELSDPTKFVFSWGMLLGRLEIWTVLSLFVPSFWRNR